MQIGKVGDRRNEDFDNFVKAADEVVKLDGQIEKEKGELANEAARAVENLQQFEKKMGYGTGVRGGAR